jgi:hypothetical protein
MPHHTQHDTLVPNDEAREYLRQRFNDAVQAYATACDVASERLSGLIEQAADDPLVIDWRRALSATLALNENMLQAQFNRINGMAMEWQTIEVIVWEIQGVCLNMQAQINALKAVNERNDTV